MSQSEGDDFQKAIDALFDECEGQIINIKISPGCKPATALELVHEIRKANRQIRGDRLKRSAVLDVLVSDAQEQGGMGCEL